LPKEQYHWHLNPGHLTADEEWMSSPMKKDSTISLKSGMLLQIDIIPSVAGYAGASCENGIDLADEALRSELQSTYPELWQRVQTRSTYPAGQSQIQLSDCVFPLSLGVAFYTSCFLLKDLAFDKN